MAKTTHERLLKTTFFFAIAVFGVGVSQSQAYWGMGDIGFGFGAFNYVPQPGDFLNQHALTRAANATGPVNNNVYANNPNAYFHRIRDNGFVPHSDISSRRSTSSLSTRRPAASSTVSRNGTPPPAAPAAPTVARPVVLIGSFFDAARVLVWPADAPVSDGLGAKRDISDKACLEISDLVSKHGAAPITLVTGARQKLLDYGQPALQLMRTHTTTRVSETFHLFLLSLYESLAQAANPI